MARQRMIANLTPKKNLGPPKGLILLMAMVQGNKKVHIQCWATKLNNTLMLTQLIPVCAHKEW